jgi:hypothetical protein
MRAVIVTVVASLGIAAVAAAAEPRTTAVRATESVAPPGAGKPPPPAASSPPPSSAGDAQPSSPPPANTPATPPASQPATSPDDQKLLEEINRAMGTPKAGEQPSGGAQRAPAGQSAGQSEVPAAETTGPGASSGTLSTSAASRTSGLFPNIYNPAMSVNGLFLGSYSSQRHPPASVATTGLSIQELELQFVANVDPYFTANLIFTVPGEQGFGLEEGYVTPSFKPAGFEARIGKLKVPFGRENVTHTHALPFIDRSLVGQAVFGDGLSEPGVELSYLVPLPWYAVLSAAAFNGNNPVMFASPDPYQKMGFGGLKNVFDLTDDATLEAGLSYAAGHGDVQQLSQAFGGHMVLKWRPARAFREREAIVVVEYIYATHPNPAQEPMLRPGSDPSVGGGYAYAQWRLAQRWYTAVRGEYLGLPSNDRGTARKGSALLAFAPTEFSFLRAQVSVGKQPTLAKAVVEGFLQLDVTLGAHPAHAY